MWPYVTVYVRVYVDACFPVFPHFRAVFATKTSWIWARFLSFLVDHHCKFSAQLEFRVKSKKKKSQKKVEWSYATTSYELRYAPLHFFWDFFRRPFTAT
jgi:outer membrane biogenesis lipoprotein LolB